MASPTLTTSLIFRLVDQVSVGMKRMLGGLGDMEKTAKRAAKGVSAITIAGGNLISAGVTRGIGLARDGLVGAADAAMDFEKSLVDIQKVARGADDTAAGMARIKAGIKDASTELGVLPNQVAELTAAITPVFSGKNDIVALAKDVTKIGVAWDVTGKEAGQFFANTSRGLGLTAEQTKDYFGSINELSNQLGIKAADLADASVRSAGVIKASGLSAGTGAALNATLIAAGASSDIAATGVRTFVARLEAGSAATKQQRKAFEALGLDAKKVGVEMSNGGAAAETQIMRVVEALGALPKERQLPVLIEMFGSESIGSIGAAATATEGLATAFRIAGGDAGNFKSVTDEYNRASNTTRSRLNSLKAGFGVMAIELGEHLLPYIDEAAKFLTSKEGKEWGQKAVAGAASAIRDAAAAAKVLLPIVLDVVKGVSSLIETIGGTGTVALLATPKILGMAAAFGGPVGLAVGVVAASAALGAFATNKALSWLDEWNRGLEDTVENLEGVAKSVANGFGPLDEWTKRIMVQTNSAEESTRRFARLMLQLQGGDVAGFDQRERDVKAQGEQRQKSDAMAAASDADWAARLARKQAEAQARMAANGPPVATGAPLASADKVAASKFAGQLDITVKGGEVTKQELKTRGDPGFRVKANVGRQGVG